MYASKQNSCRETKNHKPRKDMPSFSSTLLDEIYRSTDEKSEAHKEKPVKKQVASVRTKINRSLVEDEDMASFRRASLIDKWMMEKDETKPANLLPENDLLFFSSTSSSSDSSGALSSSDTEFFGTTKTKSKVSCFTTTRPPKPIRTGVSAREKEKKSTTTFEDHRQKNKMESRALKVYAKLKEMKQPISPGARLTSFINTLFNNANGKKSKNPETSERLQDLKPLKATSSSKCSSASSFSRSCLSKFSPRSRENVRDGLKRTVRFNPVSVVVDGDSRSCGHKTSYGQNFSGSCVRKPPLPLNASEESKLCIKEKSRRLKEADDCSMFGNITTHEVDEEEDYDAMSDSSSDLFEIDHLSLFGNNRFCEELPVYETTNLESNRTIASGLIR